MKTTTFRFILGATAAFCLAVGPAWALCAGDENAAEGWMFEPKTTISSPNPDTWAAASSPIPPPPAPTSTTTTGPDA